MNLSKDYRLIVSKAFYRISEGISVTIRVPGRESGLYYVSVLSLGREILVLQPEASQDEDPSVLKAELGSFPPGGYELLLKEGSPEGMVLAAGAFDVWSRNNETLRYGFVSDFSPSDNAIERSLAYKRAADLALRLHLTHIQFYDWMYRHHELLPSTPVFSDALGRSVDLEAVRERIALCLERGMVPVAYGAVYGAEKEYAESYPEQVLGKADGSKHDFIGIISICDISPDSEWTRHIVNQFQDACRELSFGGIHMDQYGSPKLACAADGSLLDLERCFAPLVDRTKSVLSQGGHERFVVFNCVNAWPADYLSGSGQDATYIEVWNPFSRYRHLAEIARKARLLAPGRPVVLAAYLPCFLDPDESWERRESSLRLSFAVICSNGATQLVLGEGKGVLAEGYYVNHGHWRDEFADILFSYMDFIVKHRELLFGAEVTDESLSYAGGVNEELRLCGAPWSVEYEPGCVSVSAARVGDDSVVVNLVNLVGLNDDRWATGKPEPRSVRELSLELISWGDVDEVLGASPDSNFGRLVPLPWEALSGGGRIRISLPELSYWSIVLIRFRPLRRETR